MLTLVLGVAVGGLLAGAALWLEARGEVRVRLAAPPPTAPLRIWSAPIHVQPGQRYPPDDLEADLVAAGYERSDRPDAPLRYRLDGERTEVWTDGKKAVVRIVDGRVASTEPKSGVRLRPTLLATLGDREAQRTPVSLDTVAPHVPTALLAMEDARFWDHPGIDPIGLLRAVWVDLSGGSVQGGSTLTQQLAKNLFVGPERSLRRKVREALFAAALEAELGKRALLELYLSDVYLGHVEGTPVRGVEQAARVWFGKSAQTLSVAEAATIAGVIASPNAWSPLEHPDEALRRRDAVIHRMVEVRALTEAQAEQALAAPLGVVSRPVGTGWRIPWLVDAALSATDAVPGAPDAATGGEVHLHAQPHLQRAAQRALAEQLDQLAATHPEAAAAEGAVVVLSAKGEVLALVGGRSFTKSPFPRATRAWRQAGSTIKPLTLLALLDARADLAPDSLVQDEPVTITLDGKAWSPGNSDGQFKGAITVRQALAESRNVPAVRWAEELGRATLQKKLVDAGLTEATKLPSVALGAFPVTPLQLAGAWTAFPGGGTARAPALLASLSDADGSALPLPAPTRVRLAGEDATAAAVDVLRSVLTEGTARRAQALGVQGSFAGKTGTTDDGRDAWFVGFDPEHVVVVWVGLDKGALGLYGSEAALPVWAAVVDALALGKGSFPASRRRAPPAAETPEAATPAPAAPDEEPGADAPEPGADAPDAEAPDGRVRRARARASPPPRRSEP